MKMENSLEKQRLLGAHLKRDLTWGEYLFFGEKAIIPNVKKKLGNLYLVSIHLSKESRLRLENGISMSGILYLIQFLGGKKPSWIKAIQRLQNKAAQYVT